jgi:hypothetical protein
VTISSTIIEVIPKGQVFLFTGEFFAKFRPEKYDFDVHKGFFMKKKDPNSPVSENFNLFFQSPDFYDKFP